MVRAVSDRHHRRLRRARLLIQRTVTEHFEDRCPQLAAAVAYYTLFALFPLVILAAGIFGLIEGEAQARQDIVDLVTSNVVLTEEGRETLEDALEGAATNSSLFGVLGVLGLIFSASGVMGAIRNAINTAFDVDDRRPPVHGKLIDILLVLLVGVVAALSLGITLVGRLVPDLGDGAFLVDALLRLVPIALNFAIFGLLFYVLPAAAIRLRDIWPGALLAALGYEAAKLGFAFYLTNFGNYSAVYGSVAAIIIFMLFVYIAANVFLLGAEMASEWPRVHSGRYDEKEGEDAEGGSGRAGGVDGANGGSAGDGPERDYRERARILARKLVFRRDRGEG